MTQLEEIWIPTTVQAADVVISMPKIKTHHWAGVTLSLKNSFESCPARSMVGQRTYCTGRVSTTQSSNSRYPSPIHFVIADGIEAMEGNGPLHGPMRRLGCLVFADDPVAADATSCRLIQIDQIASATFKGRHRSEIWTQPISSNAVRPLKVPRNSLSCFHSLPIFEADLSQESL